MSFPQRLSFTVTNACNLRCQMCGQWSEAGYVRNGEHLQTGMRLQDWKRLADEAARKGTTWVLIRGGEPFLLPGIIELLEFLHEKRIPTSIDTNGTLLTKYAADLVRIGDIGFTVSVDGPEEVHDEVRGKKGSFRQIEEGLATLRELEQTAGRTVERSICFTISPYSLRGLGEMPDVARRLGVPTILIVPYYWVPAALGKQYEAELREGMDCAAFSWRGFHHETSGVDPEEFFQQLRQFKASLGSVNVFPYMDLKDDDYRTWFTDATTPVGSTDCWSLDGLLDIQPGGEANICVDYPDCSLGNARFSSIEEIWNGQRAERFRELRRRTPFAVCHRCGAKYMCAERAN